MTRPRSRRVVGSLRDRFGSKRRRSYLEWAAMPGLAPSGSDWWVDDPRWFPEGTPPRAHTAVEILIDGQAAFLAAWQAIRAAKHSVWLVDWSVSVEMPLVRPP